MDFLYYIEQCKLEPPLTLRSWDLFSPSKVPKDFYSLEFSSWPALLYRWQILRLNIWNEKSPVGLLETDWSLPPYSILPVQEPAPKGWDIAALLTISQMIGALLFGLIFSMAFLPIFSLKSHLSEAFFLEVQPYLTYLSQLWFASPDSWHLCNGDKSVVIWWVSYKSTLPRTCYRCF